MIPFLDMSAMHGKICDELDEVWHATVTSGRFIGGPSVERFEAGWAEYCGTRYCVGVSSGTAALHLALSALGLSAGDEVLVPANTFIATAAAVVAAGARPVFVDVDPATLLITADGIRQGLTSRTVAVIVVHLYGQPADMDAINAVASSAAISVVEDAAQAHGATWAGKKAGSMSVAGCFSFYPGKNLGAFGDAGAVVTNDRLLADKIRSLSNHGRSDDDPYRHDLVGGNHRLDALQAAVLTVKLTRLDAWNEGRRRVAMRYAALLSGLPVELPWIHPHAVSSHHLAVIQTGHRDALRCALTAAQIATGIHYPIPCHRQAPFARDEGPELPVVERAAQRILSLPMYPYLADAQIDQVASVIRNTLEALDHQRLHAEVLK
jgi:dTDP-4-amino-4,6-dideoxygalactose transaminase